MIDVPEASERQRERGRIVFEIRNDSPVELMDLTQSLVALGREYEAYASETLDGDYATETKLYVKEIRSGSIITELVPLAHAMLPILSEANTVIGFADRIRKVVLWLLKPKESPRPEGLTVETLQNIKSIVEPVAKDSASQINIHTQVNNYGPVYVQLSSAEASDLQNRADREIVRMDEPSSITHKNVVMYLFQARNDPTSSAGDRAIIESISKRPLKLLFANEKLKLKVLKRDDNLFRHAFIVDVTVETVRGKPILYKVTKVSHRLDIDQVDIDDF